MLSELITLVNSAGFGVVLGGVISIATTIITNKHGLRLKRIQKQLDIHYDLKLSQLSTLTDLQAAIQKLGRANVECCQSLLHDGLYLENGMRQIEPSVDEKRRLMGVDVILLNSRVDSAAVREAVDEARAFDLLIDTPSEIEAFMHKSTEAIGVAMDLIGSEIRRIQNSLIEDFPKEMK